MVQFGEVKSKTTRVAFKKDDIEGYLVEGEVAYDLLKNEVTDMNGSINVLSDEEGKGAKKNIGSVRTVIGSKDRLAIDTNESMMDIVNDIAKATLADLRKGYTE